MKACEPHWVATMADGRERGQDGSGWLLAAGLGVVVGVAALVCAWGTAAGFVFGAGAPPVKTAELAQVVMTLPHHLADPRLAWPASTRASLPGPLGFYASLVLLMAIVSVGAAVFMRWRGRGRQQPGEGAGSELGVARRPRVVAIRVLGGGRFVGRRQISARGRMALGWQGRQLLRAEERHALVVFGPPQSGKSAGLAVGALLEWDGPDDRVVDKDGSTAGHRRPPPYSWPRLRLRSVRAEWRNDEYVDSAPRRDNIRGRPRGRAQIGFGRRDRPAVGREWRVLDGRR